MGYVINKASVAGITPAMYAVLAGVTTHTVRTWIKAGAIPALESPGGRYRIPHSWVKKAFPEWTGDSPKQDEAEPAKITRPATGR